MSPQTMSLSFPPFTRTVKLLIIANAAIFFFFVLLGAFVPGATPFFIRGFGLIPAAVIHGLGVVGVPTWFGYVPAIWQLLTYSFLHGGPWHLLMNMLVLWMFGGVIEGTWGSRRFTEFYFLSVLAAAVTTIIVTYGCLALVPLFPSIPIISGLASQIFVPTVGASGGVYGVLMAFGIIYAEQNVILFPLPIQIKAKYMVAIIVFLTVTGALQDMGGIANLAHLGGLLFGFLYVKYAPRRTLTTSVSFGKQSLRDRYYRWKRRRAAKKFQVYMRKQGNQTPFFDEYGNYRGPGTENDKGSNPDKDRWVH